VQGVGYVKVDDSAGRGSSAAKYSSTTYGTVDTMCACNRHQGLGVRRRAYWGSGVRHRAYGGLGVRRRAY
jgi:hypothetical protein